MTAILPSRSLAGAACVSGIGETDYTRGGVAPRSQLELQLEASLHAIEDAGLWPGDVDGIIIPRGSAR